MLPKKLLSIAVSSLLIIPLLFVIVSFWKSSLVLSSTTHVVISEVQIAGDNGADDEFIELYNPTGAAVDISSWSIQRETIGGSFAKKNFETDDSIPAHGYFLVANNDYNGVVTADMTHGSFNFSSTGTTVFVVNNQTMLTTGDELTIVDKVAIGTDALDAESSPFTTIPLSETSIERKPGESDPLTGNGTDTDDNASDFTTRNAAQPQNTSSSPEVETQATASPSPTETPSPTPTEEPTPTPTIEPTITPTSEPTTSPTAEPTAEPTVSPTAQPSVTPTPSPTPLPLPTPKLLFDRNGLACWIEYVPIQVRWWHTFILRKIVCGRG